MENIVISRNPNEGKRLKTPRIEVIQSVIDAFLKGETYCSSNLHGKKMYVNVLTKSFTADAFDENSVNPYVEEMQKAFDVLTENGYYLFVKTEQYRQLVEYNYYVSEFVDGVKNGYVPTKVYHKSYYK